MIDFVFYFHNPPLGFQIDIVWTVHSICQVVNEV